MASSNNTEKSNEAQNEESVGSDMASQKPPKPSFPSKWKITASKAVEKEKGHKVSFDPEDSVHSGNSMWNTLDVDHREAA